MLADPTLHTTPFRYLTCSPALDEAFCQALARRFEDPSLEWTEHRTFYEASIADITASTQAPPGLVERVAELTGMPLTPQVQITAQRMGPGQFAERHTDRPLLGYESVRLVLQLNRAHRGGELVVGDRVHPPTWNSAFLFVLHPGSEHAIREVLSERRTVVFHFWHAANTPELKDAVEALFSGLSFAGLGDFETADMTEEESHEAGCVAWCLQRWGRDDPQAQALARYLTRLRRDHFDPLAPRTPAGTGLPIERLAYPATP